MKRPGDCSEKFHDLLRIDVLVKCRYNPPPVCRSSLSNPAGSLLMSCNALKKAAQDWEKCARARYRLMLICYRGGDSGHIERHAWAVFESETCWYQYHYWNCGNSGPPSFFPDGTGGEIA